MISLECGMLVLCLIVADITKADIYSKMSICIMTAVLLAKISLGNKSNYLSNRDHDANK
ncbi:protein of unknown function [Candidatus Nitrosocosmicus franklandus]|uniref:Uncharacterized protein n=1 Tax=Candidatus Nitrosocosmicus franklandianus TaxID=1798806 RepID=A0A484IK02_9ARCH|nr:protein of unknown function [Candidatus Nitrosocosmicus franklandus]